MNTEGGAAAATAGSMAKHRTRRIDFMAAFQMRRLVFSPQSTIDTAGVCPVLSARAANRRVTFRPALVHTAGGGRKMLSVTRSARNFMIGLGLSACAAVPAAAQNFPVRPITVYVPF